MKLVAEYLERARRFEQLAATETDSTLKAEFERQADGLRQLAKVRAKQLGMPSPTIRDDSD